MGHYSSVRGSYHAVSPEGSIFITVYSVYHRRSRSTASGVRSLLKYNYWRTEPPQRDWMIDPDFDLATADYKMDGPFLQTQAQNTNSNAKMFLWLCGKPFSNIGGQGVAKLHGARHDPGQTLRRAFGHMMPVRVDGGGGLKPLDQLRERRRQMAHRRRRIIFNNDGDEISFEGSIRARSSWAFAPPRLAPRLMLSPTTQPRNGTAPFGWSFGRLYGLPEEGRSADNYRSILEETGKDTLETMIDACHELDTEVFYSNRMNDWHDAFNTDLLYNVRREHPERSLPTEEEGRKHSHFHEHRSGRRNVVG